MALKISNRKAVDLIPNRIAFTGSNFYGVIPSPDPDKIVTGSLAPQFHDLVRNADYIVYSYSTPILWFTEAEGCWHEPSDKYSPTTSRHQAIVRRCTLL